jgi:hypothetical protein
LDEDDLKSMDPLNLELVHWMSLDDWNTREKTPVTKTYKTFEDVVSAIDELGPLEICTDRVNVTFLRTSGRFEDDIVVIRQSGMNVRRILVTKADFENGYGSFHQCLDNVMSNNAVGASIEYAHIKDIQELMKLDAKRIDPTRKYDRAEIDVTATLQMMEVRDGYLGEDAETDRFINFVFDLGFTAGRTFSAVQNLHTLEPEARAGADAKAQNIARGKRSGSETRRKERLSLFLNEVESIYEANEGLRDYEDMVLRVAFDRAIPKGSYGHGRFDEYCIALRSDEPYKSRFDALFRKLPK